MGAATDEVNDDPKVEAASKSNPKWTQEELLLGVEGAYFLRTATGVAIFSTKPPLIYIRNPQVWKEFQSHRRNNRNQD